MRNEADRWKDVRIVEQLRWILVRHLAEDINSAATRRRIGRKERQHVARQIAHRDRRKGHEVNCVAKGITEGRLKLHPNVMG